MNALPTLISDPHGNVLCSGCAVPEVHKHKCDPRGCTCAPCMAERILGNVRKQPNFARTCDRYADAILQPNRHSSGARVEFVRRAGLVQSDAQDRCAPTEFGLRVAAVWLALADAKKRDDCDQQPVVVEVDVSDPRFVLVDVEYATKGCRALYELRTHDAFFSLAQD